MLFIFSVIKAVAAFFVWRASTAKVRKGNLTFKSMGNLSGVAAAVFSVVAITQAFTQVPAGHVGVVDFFGIVSDKTLPAGVSLVNPLARVHKYSIQTKEHKETMQVLSEEGLTINLEISDSTD